MALEKLKFLKFETIKPFRDQWSKNLEFKEASDRNEVRVLNTFYQELGDSLYEIPEPTGDDTPSPSFVMHILSNTMIQSPGSPIHGDYYILCGFSGSSEEEKSFEQYVNRYRSLNDRAGIFSEFLCRQRDLNRHLHHAAQRISVENPHVDEEISWLQQLRQEIFGRFGIKPELLGSYHPSTVAVELFHRGQGHTDCLGRTPFLQWLDSLALEPSPNHWDLLTHGLGEVSHQDILGRTILHILCQKKWKRRVRTLLDRNNADPYLTTSYGHLPLHYAAASGSAEICEMLLQHCSINLNPFDGKDCYGNSALYYAVCSRDRATLNALLKSTCHANPEVVHEQLCPSPLLKAIIDNNFEFANALANKKASWEFCFRRSTIQGHLHDLLANSKFRSNHDQWMNMAKCVVDMRSLAQPYEATGNRP